MTLRLFTKALTEQVPSNRASDKRPATNRLAYLFPDQVHMALQAAYNLVHVVKICLHIGNMHRHFA